MQRSVRSNLLRILDDWFHTCFTFVQWTSVYSSYFNIDFGVRQGSVTLSVALSSWKHYTVVGGCSSCTMDINCGVPHGSVL